MKVNNKIFILYSIFLIVLIIPNNSYAQNIKGRDYFGEINPIRFELDSNYTYLWDLDGDGKKDTVRIYFSQTYWALEVSAHKSECQVCLIDDEYALSSDDIEIFVELTPAYLTTDEKPLLLVSIEKSPAHGNEFYVYDVINTARGLQMECLLQDKEAGWSNSPVIVKPNYIEIKHFREWTIAKYVWDGNNFIKLNGE
ncbi:MAG: hypothetical protein ABIK31_01950 [candidate division WOR-3 bacterium]